MEGQPTTKIWWQSKTLWINLALAVTAIFFQPANAYLRTHPEQIATAFMFINILLRFITKDKLVIGD